VTLGGTHDGTCADRPAKQEPMFRLRPATQADRAADIDAGFNISSTDDGRACVDLYLWVNESSWKPDRMSLRATDDAGRTWSVTGSYEAINDAPLVLAAGSGCLRVTGTADARRDGHVASWQASGKSKGCS
jgi:hypothetical protein